MAQASVPPVAAAFTLSSTANDATVVRRRVIPLVGAPDGSVVASAKRSSGLPITPVNTAGTFSRSLLAPA